MSSKPFYELFERGGKRLRPVFACLAHDALGGESPDIYRLAGMIEVVHTGTLILDDIEDKSEIRRGKPAVHRIFGTELSINTGVLLAFLPQLLIQRTSLSMAQKASMHEAMVQHLTKVIAGQGLDLYWSKSLKFDVGLDDHLIMCRLKTGSLFAAAAKIGAIAAGAEQQVIDRLATAAEDAGEAFQVQDDLLNLRPSASLGKAFAEDITEGKVTFPVLFSMARAGTEDRLRLLGILTSGTRQPGELQAAIKIIQETGAIAEAKSHADKLFRSAKQGFSEALPDGRHREILLTLIDSIAARG